MKPYLQYFSWETIVFLKDINSVDVLFKDGLLVVDIAHYDSYGRCGYIQPIVGSVLEPVLCRELVVQWGGNANLSRGGVDVKSTPSVVGGDQVSRYAVWFFLKQKRKYILIFGGSMLTFTPTHGRTVRDCTYCLNYG